MKRALLCMLLSASISLAQGLTLEQRGSITFVSWKAELSVLDALTELAGATRLQLRIVPTALRALHSERADLSVRGMLLSDCAQSLAALCGRTVTLRDGVLTVQDSTNVQDGSPENITQEAMRRSAVEWYGRAALANPRAGREDDTAFRAAMLEFDGGALDGALAGFRVYAEGHAGAAQCAQAWYMAGAAAFLLERHAEARAALEHIDEAAPGSPIADEAALLIARSFLAEGRTAEALPRLHRAAGGKTPRGSALAALLEAEICLNSGNAGEALNILEKTARRLDRTEPDLTQRIPLWSGRVLLALQQPRSAVTQFQIAMLTCPLKSDRDAAAYGLMQSYRQSGDNVAALLAARAFLAMQPEGALLRTALAGIADLQSEVGMADAAVATWERLLAECPEGDALAPRAVMGLAQTLQVENRHDEARSLFGALALRNDVGQRALFESARCNFALGEYERTLSTLKDVKDAALAADVRSLRARALSALGRHREAGEVLSAPKGNS